jgi:hypothetical protein
LEDIPADNTTTATITIGVGVTSSLEVSGDHDWFKINLTAGQAITVALNGVTLADPYLRILSASGQVIYQNDDINVGVNLDSLLSFAANLTDPNTAGYNPTGVFYIDVGSYESAQTPGGTGDYQLNVTTWVQPPVWTNDQIAQQLITGYWGDGMHRFVLDQTRTITVNISGISDLNGQNLALTALQQWSSITGINFVQTTGSAQIRFTDNDPAGGAFTDTNYTGANILDSHVNVDASWVTDPQLGGPNVGGYAYQAYLHEIGHALGLGHAGNYNTTATYPYDALYQNDAWSTSVMSYFSQTENSYFAGQGFDDAYLVTPMVADILAVQQMYGLSTTTRNGDTVYGFNSNAGNPYNANVLFNVAYTIFDTGGTDTMDFSGYDVAQVLNLNPESFSSIGTLDGNVSIARGTIIENAIGGGAADLIIGNSVTNILTGGDGNDTLTGGAGNDTFRDTKSGLNGDTITDFSVGDKIVFTDATLNGFTFNLTGTTLNFTGGSLTLSAPVNGTIIASAAQGGGVQLTIQAIQDVRNDFNGDGRSDVLWRSDVGEFTNWLGQANGGFAGNGANTWYTNLPSSWQIIGTGDFNGDGRDDILWRSASGEMTNWLGQANGGFVNNGANAWFTNLPSTWQVVGTGDFNGDGRDDLMWRSTSGEFSNWLGQANGGFLNNGANSWGVGPASWKVIAVGDFNGDGRDDILWRSDAGEMSDWLGQANGGFVNNGANSWFANLPSSWQVVGTGDFNGDGRDDLMWRSTSGEYSNWLGQPNGGFVNNGANSWGVGPANWHILGIGDYNGDGRDDLLWRSDAGELSNWLANANGGFVNNGANSWSTGPTSWHVVQVDTLWV